MAGAVGIFRPTSPTHCWPVSCFRRHATHKGGPSRKIPLAIWGTVCLLASGCTSVPVAHCPPLKTYPPEFSQRLADEVDAMPADSATVEAIGDYIALRDSVRACR